MIEKIGVYTFSSTVRQSEQTKSLQFVIQIMLRGIKIIDTMSTLSISRVNESLEN